MHFSLGLALNLFCEIGQEWRKDFNSTWMIPRLTILATMSVFLHPHCLDTASVSPKLPPPSLSFLWTFCMLQRHFTFVFIPPERFVFIHLHSFLALKIRSPKFFASTSIFPSKPSHISISVFCVSWGLFRHLISRRYKLKTACRCVCEGESPKAGYMRALPVEEHDGDFERAETSREW